MDVTADRACLAGQCRRLVTERLYPSLFGAVALRLADKGWIADSSYARSGAELQFRSSELAGAEDFRVRLLPDAAAGEVFLMIKGRRIAKPIKFTVSVDQHMNEIEQILDQSLAQAVALADSTRNISPDRAD
jgi:hypothetical protein